MSQYEHCEGTVKPYPNFDPKEDAKTLKEALETSGTDEKRIMKILAQRSNSQRMEIAHAYKLLYDEDLTDRLKYQLSCDFEDVIIALMKPLNEYLASEVYNAIAGVGTNEDALTEIFCTRTNSEIISIKEAYKKLYGEDLVDAIKRDTSSQFRRLLISLTTALRSESPVDEKIAKEHAEALFAEGAGQTGSKESFFNDILAYESFQDLAVTFKEYEKLAGHSITDAIERKFSGYAKEAMIAIVRCVENRQLYYAEKLHTAMKGLGTDEGTINRIIISRCELDMVQIKEEYELKYDKPLAEAIIEDTSGYYRSILTILVNGY